MYCFLLVLFLASCDAATYQFEKQSGDIPTIHAAGTMSVSEGKLIKMFGFEECFDAQKCDLIYDNSVYERELDDPSGTWVKYEFTKGKFPEPRSFTIANTDERDGSVYVYGGVNYDAGFTRNDIFGDIWKYNPSSHKWKEVKQKNAGPGMRTGSFGRIRDGKLIVMGGLSFEPPFTFDAYNDVWSFDLDSREWEVLFENVPNVALNSTVLPPGRYLHKAELMGDSLVIMSGNVNPSILGVQLFDFWTFNLVTKTWTFVPLGEGMRSYVHGASAAWNGSFFHIGGDINDDVNECKVDEISGGQNPIDTLYIWNKDTNEWRTNVPVANAYKGKRPAYAQYGPYLFISGGFDFFCAEEPCADGTRCYNAFTSYPKFNQFLYSLDLRQF